MACAAFCALCIAKPNEVAGYARRRYLKSSKFFQKWPFSNMVMKPWYPAYLRLMGVFGLCFMLIWLYAVATSLSK